MKRSAFNFILVLLVLIGLSRCAKDNPTSFKDDLSAINFPSDSTSYSFVGDSSSEHTLKVPVRIIGDSTNQERNFEVAVIHDSLTTAKSSDYNIEGGKVEPGKFEGDLSIKLFKTPETDKKVLSLHLKIKGNGSFKPGTKELDDVTVYWTNKVIVPAWTLYQYFFTSVPSTRAYRIIIQTTGVKNLNFGNYFDYGGPTALQAKGRKFGDYIKEYNKNHPNNHLKNDDGPKAGEDIEPIYYSKSLYN